MIKFEELGEGFKIYFKDYLFFSHSKNSPCFKLGIGLDKIQLRHSSFKITDKIIEKFLPISFNVITKSNNVLKIEFFFEKCQLSTTFNVVEDKLEISLICFSSEVNRCWININAYEKEAIYGCGEQFTETNLRGYSIPLWSEDATPVTKSKFSTYFPQPTFLSTNHYFCHVNCNHYSIFDFKKTKQHELLFWDVPKKIIIGMYNSNLETVENLNKYLGIQPKLPEWVYDGIWLGIQGGPEIVDKKIEIALSFGIPVTAVWCQDWQGIRFTSFGKQLFWNWKYDEKIYPNLPEYINKLKKKNIKFIGYINTFLAIEGNLYKQEASKNDYCIKNHENKDYFIVTTDFPAAHLDLSNPNTIQWIKSVIQKNMIDIGMGGWMVDYAEYVPPDAILFSGISGKEFHNKCPTIWAKVNYEIVQQNNLLDKIIFFTRSGFTETSKYSMFTFSGDQLVDWDEDSGIPAVIPAGINVGVCGIGYYHFDIGGYTTFGKFERTKELFMRGAEMAAFSMLMRTHEGNRPDVNWQFDSDEDTLKHLASMVKIHIHLKPYLKYLSEEYQSTGIPVMRGLFLHYENDLVVHTIKFQYLLGRDLLIAPIIKPNTNQWKVYLPKDKWIHIWSEKEYYGGWVIVDCPIGQPPVFYRSESSFKSIFQKINKL